MCSADQGKILYVGSSNFAGWHLATAQYEATMRGDFGLISEQSIYNLAQRTIELEVLPAAEGLGIGVVAWSPLAGGLLASATDGGRRSSDSAFHARAQQHREALQQTNEIALELGVSLAGLAIAWLLSRPGLTAAIIGPRTSEQLEDLLRTSDLSRFPTPSLPVWMHYGQDQAEPPPRRTRGDQVESRTMSSVSIVIRRGG